MTDLKVRREKLGLTQEELASALGISQGSVSRMEGGTLPISRRTELALEALEKRAVA